MNLKKTNFTNILGWSISRYDKFLICKRKYFYDYYSKFDSTLPFEKLQFLKNLTSKHLIIGNIVHEVISDILKRYQIRTEPININKFLKYLFNITNKNYTTKVFFEHYYNNKTIEIDEIYKKICYISKNFINSEKFSWIKESALTKKSEWIIEPLWLGETIINNYKIFCKVDFLFHINDKIHIIDWKTGKQDLKKHKRQLIGYTLWANYKYNKKAINIVPSIVYLYPKIEEKTVNITDSLINKFKNKIKIETINMYDYLIDINKNIPKDKEEFELTNNKFFCKYCNYKEICV
ncbi:MAG: PD-(D/E)XK nuclease family protein [Endomicrobium sp.]|jgi:hypothetical protein|nr:PD-(D/E)XK nuclease family protein [Endomicrobium sp.]